MKKKKSTALVVKMVKKIKNDKIKSQHSFDVFLSHSSSDKDSVVRPLVIALKARGVHVWYDECHLKIGDKLPLEISNNIYSCNASILVLSNQFLKSNWTKFELDAIMSRSVDPEYKIFPIWHRITEDEIVKFNARLAHILGRNTIV